MKKIIIILILLSIILVMGCSYDQKLIEEQNNEQEQIIQDLKTEIENLKKEVEWRDKRIEELAELLLNEIDNAMIEKANCKKCLDHIEGAVHYLNIGYYTKSEAIREIQDGIDCMRSILGY